MRYERDGFSVESARVKRRPLPDDHWYHDQPPVVPGTDLFSRAFRDLATTRPPDGAIPWDKAMQWAAHEGLSRDLADVLWGVVWRIDVAERGWRVEDLKRESGGG